MIFHNLLEQLMGSEAKVKILKTFLQYPGKVFSGRELAKISGVSKTRTAEILQDLEKNNVLTKQKIGKSYGWSLNQESVLVSHLKQGIAQFDKKILEDLKNDIKKYFSLVKGISKLVLFGSVARGSESYNSDIDLFLLLMETKSKKIVKQKIDELNMVTLKKYGNPVSVIFYTEKEFGNNRFNRDLKKKIEEEGLVLIER